MLFGLLRSPQCEVHPAWGCGLVLSVGCLRLLFCRQEQFQVSNEHCVGHDLPASYPPLRRPEALQQVKSQRALHCHFVFPRGPLVGFAVERVDELYLVHHLLRLYATEKHGIQFVPRDLDPEVVQSNTDKPLRVPWLGVDEQQCSNHIGHRVWSGPIAFLNLHRIFWNSYRGAEHFANREVISPAIFIHASSVHFDKSLSADQLHPRLTERCRHFDL